MLAVYLNTAQTVLEFLYRVYPEKEWLSLLIQDVMKKER